MLASIHLGTSHHVCCRSTGDTWNNNFTSFIWVRRLLRIKRPEYYLKWRRIKYVGNLVIRNLGGYDDLDMWLGWRKQGILTEFLWGISWKTVTCKIENEMGVNYYEGFWETKLCGKEICINSSGSWPTSGLIFISDSKSCLPSSCKCFLDSICRALGLLSLGICPSHVLYIHTEHEETSMNQAEFEPAISVDPRHDKQRGQWALPSWTILLHC